MGGRPISSPYTIGFPFEGWQIRHTSSSESNYTVITLGNNCVQISNFTRQEKTRMTIATDMKPFHEASP